MARAGGKWSDLARRIVSAAVLVAVGVALALSQGIWLAGAMAAIIAITFWELARLTAWHHPELHAAPLGAARPVALAVLAGLALFVALTWFDRWSIMVLALPILVGLPGAARPPAHLCGLWGGDPAGRLWPCQHARGLWPALCAVADGHCHHL